MTLKKPRNIPHYIMVFGGLRRAMGYTEESAMDMGYELSK
jgi:hypothetical protein